MWSQLIIFHLLLFYTKGKEFKAFYIPYDKNVKAGHPELSNRQAYHGFTPKENIFPPNTSYLKGYTSCVRFFLDFYDAESSDKWDWLPIHWSGFYQGLKAEKAKNFGNVWEWIMYGIRNPEGDPVLTGFIWQYTYKEKFKEVMEAGGQPFHLPKLGNPVVPVRWNHLCHSYDSDKRQLQYVLNGKVEVSYTNVPFSFTLEDGINPNQFATCTVEKNTWSKNGCNEGGTVDEPHGKFHIFPRLFIGYITDYNVWDKALSAGEMEAWTSCNSYQVGNILPWDVEKWKPGGSIDGKDVEIHQVVSVDSKNFCPQVETVYMVFPEPHWSYDDSLRLCKRFRGTMVHTNRKELLDRAMDFLWFLIEKSDDWSRALDASGWMRMRYNDREDDGIWRDPETGEIVSVNECPDDQTKCFSVLPWLWDTQPADKKGGNCCMFLIGNLEFKHNRGTYEMILRDGVCAQQGSVFCQDTAIELELRGLCQATTFGKKFIVNSDLKKGRRFFTSYTGWELSWSGLNWIIFHPYVPGIIATQTGGNDYPTGKNTWSVVNDTCPGGDKYQVLSFTGCEESEFTCNDGSCVAMNSRCDRKGDCEDNSDERDCKIISFDPTQYVKDNPPEPVTGDKLGVIIGVELIEIVTIDEKDSLFATKIHLTLTWRDSRLQLYNVKNDINLNILPAHEKESIWVPVITFNNTNDAQVTVNDKKSKTAIRRMGNLTKSSQSFLDNIYIFEGSENPIQNGRVYEIEWICNYQIQWYPFDTQRCSMLFVPTSEIMDFVELEAGLHEYTGPDLLTEYLITSTKMILNSNEDGSTSAEVEVEMGRKILGVILTMYLPSVLMNIVGHSTNYMKRFFFEAAVSVNLTVMLVLTTMFASINNSLPKTSYIKMSDVWFLFNLWLPFIEVLILVKKETLRTEAGPINHHGSSVVWEKEKNDNNDSLDKIISRIHVKGAKVEDSSDVTIFSPTMDAALVSVDENIQNRAINEHYDNIEKNLDEKSLQSIEKYEFLSKRINPLVAIIFAVTYWIIGLMKSANPDLEIF